MYPPEPAEEIQDLLRRIGTLALEIEEVPNTSPDLWAMKGIDKKCQVIRAHCIRIGVLLGSGVGLPR